MFLLWYIDTILTSFDWEIVIVSIIEDIYVDFNKVAVEAVKMVNIFLSCRNVWLF